MSVSIRFYLHNKISKDGRSLIYIRVHGAAPAPMALSTGESVAREAWNHEGQKVSGRKERFSTEINARLDRMAHRVASDFRERLDAGEELAPEDLRLLVRPQAKFRQEAPRLVTARHYYEDWRDWYRKKKNRGDLDGKEGKDYTRSYKQIVDKMDLFAAGLLPEDIERVHLSRLKPKDITLGWIEEFEAWVHRHYTLQDNTLLRYRRVYRLLRKRAGLPVDFIETSTMRKSDKFSLWWEEVKQLHGHKEFSTPEVEAAAHAIVINCQLGLRWGDMEKLQPANFYKVQSKRHGEVTVLNLSQNKTADDVLLPVPPMAAGLLERHGWQFPVPRTRSGTAYRHQFAELMKTAAQEAGLTRRVRTKKVYNGKVTEGSTPVHRKISTHIPRHTAGTLMEQAGGRELASALLGHAEAGTTHNYIHRDPVQVAEQLLDAWGIIEKGG